MGNEGARLGALLGSLSRARLLFRLRPYDTSTEEGRALERNRRATWASTTHVMARALEAGVTLLSIPLTIGYLGKEQYGMWMAISSLLTWAVLADFGLLRGLQNHLSDAYGRDDTREAGQYMSTAFFALLGLALGLGAAFGPALWLVPWAQLLKIHEPALEREVVPALGATVGVFLAQFPLKVVKQAYGAFQRGHVANLFAIGGSLASLGVLLVVIHLKLGLPWLILASGGVTVAVAIVNLIYIAHDMPFLWPRPSAVSREALSALVRVSTPMLLFELGSLLINEVQMVIIARERGVSAVTDYSVYLKVMSVPLFLVNVLDAPYVPMYREARARGDQQWVREMFSRLQWSKFGLSLVLALLGVLGGDWLAGALSGQSVRFGPVTWALAGLTMVVGCWNGSYNNLFFAIGRVWTLVWVILANGLVTLSLTLWLTGPYGMPGVLIASTAFSLLVSGWLLPILSRDVFREEKLVAREEKLVARRTTTAEVAARVFGERVVTVVDAGGRAVARKGWYRLLPLARLLGFEADGAERERLVRLSSPGVERYERALLGERDDEVEVAQTERPEAALVGEPDPRVLGRFPSLRELRPRSTAQVRRVRLDDALREAGADEPVFVRLASWGGEVEALRGAGGHLGRLLGAEIDVAFAPLTPAQAHFADVDALLRSAGLTLWRLGWPQHVTERHWTRLTHADTALFGSVASERAAGSGRLWRARALYLRDHEALPAAEPLRLGALAALCDAAGEIDMAAACLGRLASLRGTLDEAARQAFAAHLRAVERE